MLLRRMLTIRLLQAVILLLAVSLQSCSADAGNTQGTVQPFDVLIFDPERVVDRADFGDPMRYAEGMDYVFVNGVPVIDDGVLTRAKPGRLLRRESRADAATR